jgi:hypothetical protein
MGISLMQARELTLYRKWYSDKSTIGELVYKNDRIMYVLEDVVREHKIWGVTAIPAGVFGLEITHSPRFKKPLPILKNVQGFEGVRIHSGNYPEDTHGCLLVGLTKGRDFIGSSRTAMAMLMDLLVDEKINMIQIIDTRAT